MKVKIGVSDVTLWDSPNEEVRFELPTLWLTLKGANFNGLVLKLSSCRHPGAVRQSHRPPWGSPSSTSALCCFQNYYRMWAEKVFKRRSFDVLRGGVFFTFQGFFYSEKNVRLQSFLHSWTTFRWPLGA
jgi:hypothetical protein